MMQHRRIDAVTRLLAVGTLLLLSPCRTGAQEPKTMNAFQFRPGVVVDPARGQIYVMSPDGGIDAVDLTKGERVWNTKAAEKPLGISGNRLVSQAESAGPVNEMLVVAITPEDGKPEASQPVSMPPGVRPSVAPSSRGEFVAVAQPAAGGADVSWTYSERPRRGIPPFATEALGSQENPVGVAPAVAPRPRTTSGSYRVNFATGAVTPGAGPAAPPAMMAPQVAAVAPAARIAGLPEDQFLSADGRHVLVSTPTGNDTDWDRYTLTVYERGTGKRVGEFKSHLSVVPFFVTDSRVVLETGPYSRQAEEALVEEPPKIRAVDLQTGKEVWSKEVRDPEFRGPFPP